MSVTLLFHLTIPEQVLFGEEQKTWRVMRYLRQQQQQQKDMEWEEVHQLNSRGSWKKDNKEEQNLHLSRLPPCAPTGRRQAAVSDPA